MIVLDALRGQRWSVVVGSLALIVISMAFRLPGLGENGFYGDEETTALVSRSVAEGGGFRMPSGMAYFRAVPLTVMNAVSANYLGTDQELSYRLPAAIFGALTPLLLFLSARTIIPSSLAFLAAILLVFSEWHVITSREARMYAPFMLCFMVTGVMMWRWANTLDFRKGIFIFIGIFATLSFHALGVMLALFPAIWVCFESGPDVRWRRPAFISVLTIVTYNLVNKLLIFSSFDNFRRSGSSDIDMPATSDGMFTGSIIDLAAMLSPWIIGGLIGGVLGFQVTRRIANNENWLNDFALRLLSVGLGATCVGLQFYAAGLIAATLLLLFPGRCWNLFKMGRRPIAALLLMGIGYYLLSHGFAVSADELRQHLAFPYPYFLYYWRYSPSLFLLFWIAVAILATEDLSKTTIAVRSVALVVIGITAAVGVAMKWGGMRYLISAYPFMLICACYPFYRVIVLVSAMRSHAGKFSTVIVGLAILCGAITGHGFKPAMYVLHLAPGSITSPLTFGFPFYPDHQSAGIFVRKNSDETDIVVAEDALQQDWYTGRVDYWLRDPVSNRGFTYEDADGRRRDIYVNSLLLADPNAELACTSEVTKGITVWIITSGETLDKPDDYLSDTQRKWLDGIRSSTIPVFVGRDGKTSVYKISC